MPGFLKTYLVALAIMLPLDAAWIGWVAIDFYRAVLGPIMLETPRLGAAALFYLLYPAGLVHFAIRGTDGVKPPAPALYAGALFGFFAYMTYDLTNLATLRAYTTSLALLDIAWGSAVSAATAGGTAFLLRRSAAG